MTLDDALFCFAYHRAFAESLHGFRELSGITRLIKNNCEIERLVRDHLDTVMEGTATMEDFCNTVYAIENVAGRSHLPELSFFHIQALINTTAKYLYLGCYRNPNRVADLASFHCPMDRQMIGCVWKQLRALDRTLLNKAERAELEFFLLKDTEIFLCQSFKKENAFLQYKLFQKMVAFLTKREQCDPMTYYWMHHQA